MASYLLFDNVEVRDPTPLADYVKRAAEVAADYGGRYVAMDAVPEVVEGDPGLRSVVLMEFPDANSARAWYESPAYQPLKEIRHRAVRNNAVLIAG
jgi:uncharacterized protein (DUF1330 family)